jgi:23S rRNA (cytosine1962-C5)-methyltransferase
MSNHQIKFENLPEGAEYPKVVLKSGKDEAVRRFHPWIFSGAIKKIYGHPADGDLVEVFDNKDEFLAVGHFQNGSIAIRILSFTPVIPNKNFWHQKISSAFKVRQLLGLTEGESINAYRLVHAEGDGMPGLIIDVYGSLAVMQSHSAGMHNNRNIIAEAIIEATHNRIETVYYKSSETLPQSIDRDECSGFLVGNETSIVIKEYGNKFNIDPVDGQKTGFFLDQRENRQLLAKYCVGMKVLNTFCYTGGFSVYALNSGAEIVHSVDSSRKAIALCSENIALNGYDPEKHLCIASDTLEYLKSSEEKYDIIILDPPAYAKHMDVRHNAVQGYKRLNAMALEKIAAGGLLFTFSCSQVVDRRMFESTVMAAAIQAGRVARVLYHLSQPPDHPVSAFHPEGEYLKGMVVYVE